MSRMLKDIEHLGYKVFTFNHNRSVPTGMRGWCDHVVLYPPKGLVVFIEDKFGSDTPNREQLNFKDFVTRLEKVNPRVIYKMATDDTYTDIVNWLINQRVK
jgi:hypothetical protein